MTTKPTRKELNRQKREAYPIALDFARPLFDYPKEKKTGKPDTALVDNTTTHLLATFPTYNRRAMEAVAARAVREIRKEYIDAYEPTYRRDTPFGGVLLDFDDNDAFFLKVRAALPLLQGTTITVEGRDNIMALYRHLGAAIERMDRVIASKAEKRDEQERDYYRKLDGSHYHG